MKYQINNCSNFYFYYLYLFTISAVSRLCVNMYVCMCLHLSVVLCLDKCTQKCNWGALFWKLFYCENCPDSSVLSLVDFLLGKSVEDNIKMCPHFGITHQKLRLSVHLKDWDSFVTVGHLLKHKNHLSKPRIEPATFRSSVWLSPNWAILASLTGDLSQKFAVTVTGRVTGAMVSTLCSLGILAPSLSPRAWI